MYCHYEFGGGVPVASSIVYYVEVVYPNGEKDEKERFTKDYYDALNYDDWFAWKKGIYVNPSSGSTGTLTVNFYDEKGSKIGTGSVQIVK